MEGIIDTLIYFLIGIVACVIGYKVFDLLTPFNLSKEIDDHNIAAGIVIGGMFVAIAIVVSSAII